MADDAADAARLEKLAAFQLAAVTAALTKFPNVDRVAYSTCSVHAAENEAVVAAALAAAPGWQLRPALPAWPRRGAPHAGLDLAQSDCLVRCDPAEDATNGFFVALFERGPERGPARKKRRVR